MPTTTGCMTDAGEALFLDHFANKTTWTYSNPPYIALWAGSPTDTGAGGAEVTSAGSNGYARQSAAAAFGPAGSRAITTTADITFGPCTTTPWSGVTHWALMSASTGGTMWAWGDITDGTVGVGDTYKILTGALTLTFTAGSKWTTTILNTALDHMVGNADAGAATDTYIALYNGDPLGAGTEVTTAGSNGYARQNLDDVLSPASGGTITNGSAITFGPAVTSGWAEASYYAIMSASTGGSVLHGAALTNAKTVAVGDSAEFAISALSITID